MSPANRSFPVAGLLSALACSLILWPTGILEQVPGVGALFSDHGPVGVVAFLIVVIGLWVLLYAVFRFHTLRKEFREAALARSLLDKGKLVTRPPGDAGTAVIWQRIPAQRHPFMTTTDDDGVFLATRAEIDHARTEVSYLPARALVWALPALGFIGTAKTMSGAIGALEKQGSNFDLAGVVGPLSHAFDITVFALGAAVVCHLLLTWMTAREQRLLLVVEEVALDVHRAADKLSAGDMTTRLGGGIRTLTDEMEKFQKSLAEATHAVAGMKLDPLTQLQAFAPIVPLLTSIDNRLGHIRDEAGQDLVITRGRLR